VTTVDEVSVTASSATTPPVEARLFAVLDNGATVRGKPTFNDDKVVIVPCFVILSMQDCGHLRDERLQSIYRLQIENL
jgi:hypothetical protein